MKPPRFEHEKTGPRWPLALGFDPQCEEPPPCPRCKEDRIETPCEHCGSRWR